MPRPHADAAGRSHQVTEVLCSLVVINGLQADVLVIRDRFSESRMAHGTPPGRGHGPRPKKKPRNRAPKMEGITLCEIPAAKADAYTVAKGVDEWIAERDQDQIDNTKAKHLTTKLLDWCRRNGITDLSELQNQKQPLKAWRVAEWKYRAGDSSSLKVHWSILGTFFRWSRGEVVKVLLELCHIVFAPHEFCTTRPCGCLAASRR